MSGTTQVSVADLATDNFLRFSSLLSPSWPTSIDSRLEEITGNGRITSRCTSEFSHGGVQKALTSRYVPVATQVRDCGGMPTELTPA